RSFPPPFFPAFPTRRSSDLPVLLNLRCPWVVETGPAAFDYLNLRQLDALFAKTPTDAPLKPLRNRIVFVGYVAIGEGDLGATVLDRKSTRLNSSHGSISYAV